MLDRAAARFSLPAVLLFSAPAIAQKSLPKASAAPRAETRYDFLDEIVEGTNARGAGDLVYVRGRGAKVASLVQHRQNLLPELCRSAEDR